jgi:type VI secretion system secreted protein VgrG
LAPSRLRQHAWEQFVGKYTQAGKAMAVRTPLGDDALLLEKFAGTEAISEPFQYQLDMLAEKGTAVPFEGLLGQKVTVELRFPDGSHARSFNGLVRRLSQGTQVHGVERDAFVQYQADIVPAFWFLSRNLQSRIFQTLSVPDILKKVLQDEWQLDVTFKLFGTYFARDYCVQYRESDFAFTSRLMEEEGIYYFFVHSAGGHQMVVADTPPSHPDLPGVEAVVYDEQQGGARDQERIHRWFKNQEVRAGKVTLWDYCFELPGAHLGAQSAVGGRTVAVGKVNHPLQVGGNQKLEVYDFPGGYAQRFDGVSPWGTDRPENLGHIYQDNQRTANIRLEQEAVAGLRITGESTCWQFATGHRFTLQRHFDADGVYVLTRVRHAAHIEGAYTTGRKETPRVYENHFECIPLTTSLPFRPQRVTPKPKIEGPQTAVVTSLPGGDQECFVDKYGRIKVQFHWDRQGTNDTNSSCWVRVAQDWAGKKYGAFFWPRQGHEVVVLFEDGDPDRPLVVGSVYNAANMPPLPLPDEVLVSGFKSNTHRQTSDQYFNGIFFVDEPGREHLAMHSERYMTFDAELDKLFRVGRYHHEIIPDTRHTMIGGIPGDGGGSGGGPPAASSSSSAAASSSSSSSSDTSSPDPDLRTWDPKQPVALGTNAVLTVGENLSSVMGVNFQLFVGNNAQIVLNPLAVAGSYYTMPAFWGVLGAGLGGNLGFTMGMNTNLQWGQVFQINLGPGQITMDAADHLPTKILSGIICGLGFLWQISYAASSNFDERTRINKGFGTLIDLFLVALLEVEMGYKTGFTTLKYIIGDLFEAGSIERDASFEAQVRAVTSGS